MKKVVRTVWIGLLSGLAFLVACTSHNKLSREEKKQLKAERTAIMEQIEQKQQEAIVYSNPDQVMIVKRNELELRSRLKEINALLGDKKAVEEDSNQMNKIYYEIDSLTQVINESNITPCVYGPPVDDPGYEEWKKDHTRQTLYQELEELQRVIESRENSCVYGSPEIIRKYGEETNRLKKEAQDLRQRIKDLDNE